MAIVFWRRKIVCKLVRESIIKKILDSLVTLYIYTGCTEIYGMHSMIKRTIFSFGKIALKYYFFNEQ